MLIIWKVLLPTNEVLGSEMKIELALLFHNLSSVYLTDHLTFLNLNFIHKMRIKPTLSSQSCCKDCRENTHILQVLKDIHYCYLIGSLVILTKAMGNHIRTFLNFKKV